MIRGSIDFIDNIRLRGWAQNSEEPGAAVSVVISDADGVLGSAVADRFRADLKDAGIGRGHHGFEFTFPTSLSPSKRHVLSAHTSAGSELPGSPIVLEALHPTALAVGNVDRADRNRIEGWCQDDARSGNPVSLIITDNGQLVGRTMANRYRADLEAAGIGDGHHAFEFEFLKSLSHLEKHFIRVLRDPDGLDVPGSPIVIEPSDKFDARAEAALSELLARYNGEEDIDRKILFLAAELSSLAQKRADTESNRNERRRLRQLARRWGGQVSSPTEQERENPFMRALIIDDRVPVLERDAGSNAIVSHMRSLQRLGYEVSFAPASELNPNPREVALLQSAGLQVCALPFYGSTEEALWRQAGEFDLVYLHRISNAAKYGEIVRQHFPKARKIYSVADLHHIRIARQAIVEGRNELETLARRLKFAELLAAASSDVVITHSEYEAQVLRSNLPKANIHRVLWSVDPKPTRVPFEARSGIALIGGYDHAPNLDAAKWLMSSLVPRIRQLDPAIQCYLVGAGLPEQLKKMKIEGLTVVGPVPDLSEIFDRVRLTIAPLSFGAGIKGKIIESMAAAIPCIHTSIAAEGMGLPDALTVCRADDAESIARVVCSLHSSRELYDVCAEAGLRYVQEKLSNEELDEALRRAIS